MHGRILQFPGKISHLYNKKELESIPLWIYMNVASIEGCSNDLFSTGAVVLVNGICGFYVILLTVF